MSFQAQSKVINCIDWSDLCILNVRFILQLAAAYTVYTVCYTVYRVCYECFWYKCIGRSILRIQIDIVFKLNLLIVKHFSYNSLNIVCVLFVDVNSCMRSIATDVLYTIHTAYTVHMLAHSCTYNIFNCGVQINVLSLDFRNCITYMILKVWLWHLHQ